MYQVQFFESLVWLYQWLNPSLLANTPPTSPSYEQDVMQVEINKFEF